MVLGCAAIAHGHEWSLVGLLLQRSSSNGKTGKKAEGLTGRKYCTVQYVEYVSKGPLKGYSDELRSVMDGEIMKVEVEALSHSSKVAAAFVRQKADIITLLQPPSSPDLNAIEPLWMAFE